MYWSEYVNVFGRAFQDIYAALLGFTRALVTPIGELVFPTIPNAGIQAIFDVFVRLFGNYSLLTFVLGGGMVIFLLMTLVKWISSVVRD